MVDELRRANERLVALLYAKGADYNFIRPSGQTESENDALRDISSDLVAFRDQSLLGKATFHSAIFLLLHAYEIRPWSNI